MPLLKLHLSRDARSMDHPLSVFALCVLEFWFYLLAVVTLSGGCHQTVTIARYNQTVDGKLERWRM